MDKIQCSCGAEFDNKTYFILHRGVHRPLLIGGLKGTEEFQKELLDFESKHHQVKNV